MTQEKLKELLESGAITQEEFDEMAKRINADIDLPEPTETEPVEIDEKLDKLIQSRFDKAMAKERKEKADLKKKLENLQKKMLTDDEKKQLEFERQQQELEEQRQELETEKNKMYAVKVMKKNNIGDSEETLLLIEKLVSSCSGEADIEDMVTLQGKRVYSRRVQKILVLQFIREFKNR